MRRRTSLVSLTASAVLICVSGAAPAAAAAAPRTTTDTGQAAAGWLAQQFDDHFETSGFFDGGPTADAIFALAASKTGATKIASTISYFKTHVQDYTSINDTTGKPGPFDGAVAKTAVAAIVAGADPRDFGGHDLVQALKKDQCTSVSGSATDFTVPTCPAIGAARNIFSSISESFAIIAESRGGSAPNPDAVAYFLSLQCPDGGFTSATVADTTCTSDIDATGYAVAALVALDGHAAQTKRAADWLTSQRNPAGYWTSQGGPNVDSTGLAAAALTAAGRHSTTSKTWLASQQVTTGPTIGPGASRGALKFLGHFDPSASIKGTADGLLGLSGLSLATLTSAGAAADTAVLALATPTLSSATLRPGAKQSVTGLGFRAGEQVRAGLLGSRATLAHGTAAKSGTVTLSFTVPSGTSPGRHTVVLSGATSGLTSRAAFSVTSPSGLNNPPGGSGGLVPSLANTGLAGRTVVAQIALGLGCLIVGGLVSFAGRRRTP